MGERVLQPAQAETETPLRERGVVALIDKWLMGQWWSRCVSSARGENKRLSTWLTARRTSSVTLEGWQGAWP